MAKRVKTQATREAHEREEFSSDENVSDEEATGPKVASSEVLKGRKILKPRSLLNRSSGASAPTPAANPFASVGQSGPSTFSFTPKRPSPLTTNSPLNSANGAANATIDKSNKLKALNNKVVEAILAAQKKDDLADFSPIFTKYIEYMKDLLPTPSAISSLANSASAVTSKPKEESAEPASDVIQVDSASDSESEDEIKVEGPTFSVAAPVSLKFGNQDDDDDIVFSDDSEDDVKVEGPKFTFSAAPSSNFNGVFKLDKKANSEKSSFTLGKKEDPKNEESAPTPTFTFGNPTGGEPNKASASSDSAAPVFSFGKPAEAPASTPAPAFSFGKPAETNVDTKAGGFSFDKPAASSDSKPAPAFSFAKPQTTENPVETKAEAPLFSFGKPADEQKQSTAPAFSFSKSDESKTEPAAPAFSFGKPAEKKEPTFSFGKSPEEKTEASAPVFSFGKPAATETSAKPALSFGAPAQESKSEETASPFKFPTAEATNGDAKPADFTWKPSGEINIQSEKQEPKPLFGTSTGFSFSNSSDSKPVFAFGNKDAASATTASAPAFNFSFKAPESGSNGSNGEAAPAGEEDAAEENDVKGDFGIVKLSEKVEVRTGEEDEDCTITKRAKLMQYHPDNKESPYESKGLGELKLLVNKATNKARLVLRSDGNGNVLLNTNLSRDLKYDKFGNGTMLRCPVISPEGLQTYILKIKTAADVQEVIASIDAAKSNLS
ncbi:unnamed protein product [Kuraishia capsulata CBS 1993]|uniref:RanBD1 domain-containing protein n=1 Tax=Kuraishia capsulata CBS 1993 TaxID=1382522 RepID=W6MW82_9ASCO|nr:uncharacterized protein KUCA_T00002967001 [Kuraishia capsulata CBS 1993]CDK26990.1 unnamed protein product [Kuraishia capsulata CBS 1993]